MNDKQPSDFGRQLSQIVQDAVMTGDYTQLKSAVNVTVQEIKQTVNTTKTFWTQNTTTYQNQNQNINPPPYAQPPQRQGGRYPVFPQQPRRQRVRYPMPPQQPVRPVYQQPQPQQPPVYNGVVLPPKRSVPGSVASTLLLLFGILGLIPAGLTTLGMIPSLYFSGDYFAMTLAAVFCVPLDLVFLTMIVSGKSLRGLVGRFRRYMTVMQGARYYSIDQLAAATGETKDYLVRDLRRMIRKGMFVDAYIDDQETCIMLDRGTYQQYLTTKQNLEQRRLQEERRQFEEEQREFEQKNAESAPPDSVTAIVAEGRSYIQRIKEANNAIPNEEISSKLYRLEAITTKVFAYVETHPDKLPEIRKFMNYYLPTTLKLVNAYREFDAQPVDGNNISNAKKEIQDILETINNAFENLLDGLFADDAMDISTDISALNIMLAQDGLTDSDFKAGK